jgi:tight adherence protein C
MVTLAYALVFAAVTLFLYQFFESEEERKVRQALHPETPSSQPNLLLFRLTAPFVRLLIPALTWVRMDEYRRRVARRLVAAGLRGQVSPDEFLGYRIVVGLGMGLAGTALVLAFDLMWLLALVMLLLGFYFPRFWLSTTIESRRREVLKHLPYFIDLLTLSVEAGLDFQIALQRVVNRSEPSALRDEFGLTLQEIKMGKTRADALRALADRVNISDITSFAAVLVQADQLGASIGSVLRAQSDKMRTERFQRAERLGAQAATKVLIPIMLFVLPALFIVMFGSFLLSFWKLGGDLINAQF